MIGGGAHQRDDLAVGLHVVGDAGERHLDRLRQRRPFSGAGTHQGSRMSRWLMTSRPRRTSRTSRASGPCADMNCAISGRSAGALGLNAGMRPWVGLIVAMPLQNAGQRSEPPMSLPCAMVAMPAAIEAPAPPDEPPQVIALSHGFFVSAVQRIVGEAAHREFRRVGQPEDDRAGLLEVGGHRGVAGRDVVLEGRRRRWSWPGPRRRC